MKNIQVNSDYVKLDIIPELPQRKTSRRQRELMRKKRRQKIILARVFFCAFMFLFALVCAFLFKFMIDFIKGRDYFILKNKAQESIISMSDDKTLTINQENLSSSKTAPGALVDFLTVNDYSRPGEPLNKVKNIFIHYTANAGTSAAQNKSYFENLKHSNETSASAHFIIGYDGEIIQCIPLDEIAYAVKGRNYDSISIECCYLSENGEFTDETYKSLLSLTSWLLKEYDLSEKDIKRHYDEGGKNCPKFYVENEASWNTFLKDVKK